MRRRNNRLKMLFELYHVNKFLQPDMICLHDKDVAMCISNQCMVQYSIVTHFPPNTNQERNKYAYKHCKYK